MAGPEKTQFCSFVHPYGTRRLPAASEIWLPKYREKNFPKRGSRDESPGLFSPVKVTR